MQAFKTFTFLLFFVSLAYIVEGERECRPVSQSPPSRDPKNCPRLFKVTDWEVETENDRFRIECRCLPLRRRQCRQCNYEDSPSTTAGPIPETTSVTGGSGETSSVPIETMTTQQPVEPDTTIVTLPDETTVGTTFGAPDITTSNDIPTEGSPQGLP